MRIRRGAAALGAGARDRWVTIQGRPDDGTGDSGFPSDGPWVDLATVAMSREDVEAAEVVRASQTLATLTTRWAMPYRADCDPERVDVPKLRRLAYLGRTYDIVSATPIGRRRGIELVTEATAKTPSEATV